MREHPNAVRIRDLFKAFEARDLDAIRDVLSETAVWHFPGTTGQLAGSHSGHGAIFGFLARVSELTEGTFRLDLEDVIANDTHAAVFFRGSARRNDRALDNPTCLKIRLQDGRATEIWEFVWDLPAVDEFWS